MVRGLGGLTFAAAICASLAVVDRAAAEPAPFMMRTTLGGRLIEGQPLVWTDEQMLLLGRDGVLYDFHPAEAKQASRFGQGFVPYSTAELRGRLRQEFDASFEVSATAHFVVVHPRGQWRAWADRLESLYRSFTHYVSVRGFQPRAPIAPLVAVVFRNQQEYFEYAAAGGTRLQPGTLGHYDPTSNRVFLFDLSGAGGDADWAENAATIIHEATHQTAYNVGVHRRFAEQPRWAVEGLAMMFEARGVWNASSLQSQADRINTGRLNDFRRAGDERPSDWLVQLVANDKRFDSDAMNAYADAWMLTFYLCETRPQEYSAYLARLGSRKAFSEYTAMERVTDFAAAFGGDFEMLAAQLGRFVDELP